MVNQMILSLILPIDTSECPSVTVRNLNENKQIRTGCLLCIKNFVTLLSLCSSETNGFYSTGIKSHVWIFRYMGIATDLWTVEFFDSSKTYNDRIVEQKVINCTCNYRFDCIYGVNEYVYSNCFKMYTDRFRRINKNMANSDNSDNICSSCKTNTCPDKILDRDKNKKVHFWAKRITGPSRCIRAALLVMCILKFRRNEFKFQGLLDKHITKMIGTYIYNTKNEEIWKR